MESSPVSATAAMESSPATSKVAAPGEVRCGGSLPSSGSSGAESLRVGFEQKRRRRRIPNTGVTISVKTRVLLTSIDDVNGGAKRTCGIVLVMNYRP